MIKNIFIYEPSYSNSLILQTLFKLNQYYLSNYNLYIINDDNINNYINIDDLNFNKLSLDYKKDLISSYMLYKFGGIWLNNNVLIIDSLDEYFNLLNNKHNLILYLTKNDISYSFHKDIIISKSGEKWLENWHNTLIQNIHLTNNINLHQIFKQNFQHDNNYLYFDLDKTIMPISYTDDNDLIYKMLYKTYINYNNIDDVIDSNHSFILIKPNIITEINNLNIKSSLYNNSNLLSYFLNKSVSNK